VNAPARHGAVRHATISESLPSTNHGDATGSFVGDGFPARGAAYQPLGEVLSVFMFSSATEANLFIWVG
jgi:hypothetical protein